MLVSTFYTSVSGLCLVSHFEGIYLNIFLNTAAPWNTNGKNLPETKHVKTSHVLAAKQKRLIWSDGSVPYILIVIFRSRDPPYPLAYLTRYSNLVSHHFPDEKAGPESSSQSFHAAQVFSDDHCALCAPFLWGGQCESLK